MDYKREFKKHWRRAAKLKEGGTAWEREMAKCQEYMELGKKAYQENLKAKYGY